MLDCSIAKDAFKNKYAPFYNCAFGFECAIISANDYGGDFYANERRTARLPGCNAVSLIGGKWKLLILRNLKVRPWRFNELQRDIDGISQKVLTDSLRQMMSDGLAYRHDYQEQPPRVEYGLTELGKQMLPIVDALADFGNYYKSVVGQNENA